MPLYLLWWDNGEEIPDHAEELLGAYTSRFALEEAKRRYLAMIRPSSPWLRFKPPGKFVESTLFTDLDIFEEEGLNLGDLRRAREALDE